MWCYVISWICLVQVPLLVKADACPETCVCETDGTVTCYHMTVLPTSFPANTRVLTLNNLKVNDVPSGAFSNLRHLHELHVYSSNIAEIQACAFSDLHSLKVLTISESKIGIINEFGFSSITNVTTISIYSTIIGIIKSYAFFDITDVVDMTMYNLNVTTFSTNAIYDVSNVKYLSIYMNTIGTFKPQAVANIKNISSFDIYMNRFKTYECGALEEALIGAKSWSFYSNELFCDCRLAWLYQEAQALDFTSSKCYGPPNYVGRSITDLTRKDVGCESTNLLCGPIDIIAPPAKELCRSSGNQSKSSTHSTSKSSVMTTTVTRQSTVAILENCPNDCVCKSNGDVSCHLMTKFPSSFPKQSKSISMYNFDLPEIPSGAFSGLSELKEIHIFANNIGVIKSCAFSGLTNIKTLTIYNSVIRSIESYAFSAINNASSFTIYSSEIGDIKPYAFFDISHVTDVSMYGLNITKIESHAFYNFKHINHVTFYMNVIDEIQTKAFSKFSDIDSSYAYMNRYAIFQCDALHDVMTSAEKASFYENDMYCDCGIHWILSNKPSTIDLGRNKCYGPQKYDKFYLNMLTAGDLQCTNISVSVTCPTPNIAEPVLSCKPTTATEKTHLPSFRTDEPLKRLSSTEDYYDQTTDCTAEFPIPTTEASVIKQNILIQPATGGATSIIVTSVSLQVISLIVRL